MPLDSLPEVVGDGRILISLLDKVKMVMMEVEGLERVIESHW